MKRKPWPIIVLSLMHVLAPIGNIVFNSHRAGRSYSQTWDYWYYNLPKSLFLAYVVLPPVAGVLIYICRRWSYYSYVVCLGLIFLANVYGFWTGMNWVNFLALLAVLVVDVLAVAYFVVPSVRKVYFDPRMRWWETAPRYTFDVQADVNGVSGLIKNISEGGVLLETSSGCTEGNAVDVEWSYQGTQYSVSGQVVYRKPLPNGIGCGVRFEHTPQTEKLMKTLIASLHKQGKMVPDRLPGPEDSFGAWLKKLFSTREGLFPKG